MLETFLYSKYRNSESSLRDGLLDTKSDLLICRIAKVGRWIPQSILNKKEP